MKKRFLFHQLNEYLSHKNALLITGMRQVGKTTLLKQVYEEIKSPKIWFDFDNPFDYKLFENDDYNGIYKHLNAETGNSDDRLFVFIDEIQNYPPVTKVIKYMIDHYKVKFILTGSSNFYLKNLFPESLSGRKFLFFLPPLSFREVLYFNDIINADANEVSIQYFIENNDYIRYKKYEPYYDEYLKYGGFPEVIITSDSGTKKLILNNILISFFEKDLKLLSDYKNIRELRDLILLLVPRTGNILDITRLSNELGINRVKIYEYIEFLQGTFFIRLLPKFSKSIDKSVAGGKKVYFADTGLLNNIGQVSSVQLLENTVVNQLLPYGELSYYNKSNSAEINVILDKKIAFEIKEKGTSGDISKLMKLSTSIGFPQHFVISKRYVDAQFLYPMFL